MRVAFGTDQCTTLTEELKSILAGWGHQVVETAPEAPWPEVGRSVGQLVAEGSADVGVVCCWTGTGVTIAANKVHGVRAALCVDAETARGARRWNDANVVGLSLRLTSTPVASEVLEAFLATAVDPGDPALPAELE